MKLQKQTGRNIISVTELQQYIGNTDASISAFLQTCISSISMDFENYCQKGLKENEYVDYYDGTGTNTLWVSQFPINSISALQYQTSPVNEFQDFYTGSSTANILTCDSGKIILYDQLFSKGINNIKIIYTAGYANCPFDLKKVAMEACVEMAKESDVAGIGKSNLSLKSKSNSNEQYSFESISERTKEILDRYRKVSI